jgi:hypothetical protein
MSNAQKVVRNSKFTPHSVCYSFGTKEFASNIHLVEFMERTSAVTHYRGMRVRASE